jgi:hypothetical protein
MIARRMAIFAALSVAFYPVLPALPASDPDLLGGLDTDHDGTVSLDEAKKAASIEVTQGFRGIRETFWLQVDWGAPKENFALGPRLKKHRTPLCHPLN